MYHNFTNLFSKLSESTFYKEISNFRRRYSYKYLISHFTRDCLTLLRTPVNTIFRFTPKIDRASVVMLQCVLG